MGSNRSGGNNSPTCRIQNLYAIVEEALPHLERLATEEARANRGRVKAGLPKQTKTRELWERAKLELSE